MLRLYFVRLYLDFTSGNKTIVSFYFKDLEEMYCGFIQMVLVRLQYSLPAQINISSYVPVVKANSKDQLVAFWVVFTFTFASHLQMFCLPSYKLFTGAVSFGMHSSVSPDKGLPLREGWALE